MHRELSGLPTGTRLRSGEDAVVEVMGLRNPCAQLDGFQQGLMTAMLDRTPDGALVGQAGVMGVVLRGGVVRPGDANRWVVPDPPHRALAPA